MVMSNYLSQFTLAAAAVNYLQDNKKWIKCINALITIVLHGLDAAGGAGELASRVILLCAMQKAMFKSGKGDLLTGRLVCLVNFLEALTGKKEDDLQLGSTSTENRNDLLKNGMIFWNNFSLIKYSPTSKEVLSGCKKRLVLWNSGSKSQQGPHSEDENHKLTDIYAKVKTESNPDLILYMNSNSQQNDTLTLPPFAKRTRSDTGVARTQDL
ncbi:hypothetical protein H4Q26_005278 [Puccinia striiformis f. sp. tritici PST-130]|uniref:Uncharacterized protein n=1 Tax=Puccinia striiformis f. sp. tritici PST-78 TaxID=1165861 RepID=A0A0L0UPB9_9BASI|nr:hypothetical protein H4Q26_005278 [Puccinia striiformis f. sp. tritici PST-130]KNE88781.1 hypothetical protein PSTG_17796 [Puccinia striiformis f. sp. tritici PST-78]